MSWPAPDSTSASTAGLWASAAAAAQDAWTIVDDRGRILAWNPGAEALYGRDAAQARVLTLHDLAPPEARDETASLLRTAVEQGRAGPCEMLRVGAAGARRWVSTVATAFVHDGVPALLVADRDVTAQVQAQRAVRSSEARLRSVADALPVLISYVDRDERYRFNNAAYGTWFDKPESAFAGRHLREVLGDAAYAAVRPHVQAALAGQHATFETTVPYRDAGARFVAVDYVPHRGDDGAVLGFSALVRDQTDTRRVLEELRDREARLRAVLATRSDIVLTVDPDGSIESWNAGAEAAFGWQEHEIVGRSFRDVLVGDRAEALLDELRACWRRGTPVRTWDDEGVRGRRRNGSTFALDLSLSLGEADGKRVLTVIGRDVTRRVAAERELRLQRDFAENLIDIAPAIVLVLDAAGRVVRCNRFMEELTGWQLHEVRGKDWLSTFVPEAERPRVGRVFERAVRGERTIGNVNGILTKDGRRRDIEWYDTVITSATGATEGVLAIGLDLTARKQLEEQLLQAQKMEAVGRLAGGIAHDFNNLLMGILSYTRMALDDLEPESPAAPLLREVLQAIETGGRLTRQLLDFSRKRPLSTRVIDLRTVLAGSQAMLQKLAGDDVVLRVETGCCSGAVLADPVQIEQVVMNLVVNARDAMPRGGRLLIECKDVELDAAAAARHRGLRPGPHVVLSVRDTGSGMPPEVRARALEPFFTTKPPGQGTGLGLSTVYGIVTRLGGHLELDSEPERGTTVRITLPRAAAAPGAATAVAEEVAAAPGRGETVLVVDDSRLVRSSVRQFLRSAGYQVLDAGDGEEALQVARAHHGPIHLLLTDVLMPVVDGLELAERLCAERPQTRVLFMSARVADVHERPGMEAVVVMEKPFTREALTARVRAMLDANGDPARH